jgi:hypothetical protein
MNQKKNLLERLGECYNILTNKKIIESISVNEKELQDEEHRKKMFSLERELSDLMDTGISKITSEDERKYMEISYGFRVSSNRLKSFENAYALIRKSYVENDKEYTGSNFMDARIPLEAIPEKIDVGEDFNGGSTVTQWYVAKETMRVFGFTHETFKELFYRSGYDLYLSNIAVVDKDNSVKLGTESIYVDMHINDFFERNRLKNNYVYSQKQEEERVLKKEQERRAYLKLKEKFEDD